MRIISGTAKGRRLFGPKSLLIRPVADKVKGAIFNILPSMEGCRVLDLFAGSGSVGLEAASRGAAHVVFVDASPQALALLRRNIRQCRFEDRTNAVCGKIPAVLRSLARHGSTLRLARLRRARSGLMVSEVEPSKFDFIFVDPPYDKNLVSPTLAALRTNKLIDAETWVIIEHSPRELPECPGLVVTDQRKYGQTLISFMKQK